MRVFDIMQSSAPARDVWLFAAGGGRMVSRPRVLWVNSAFHALRAAGGLYIRHFLRFLITFWLPLLPLDIYVMIYGQNWVTWVIWFFLGLFALSALAITVSDVCNGYSPDIMRSFRRLGWKRVGYIVLNALVLTLFIGGPPAAAIGATLVLPKLFAYLIGAAVVTSLCSLSLAVLMMYVPIISALEEKATPLAAMQRSLSLGMGYYGRSLLVIMLAVIVDALLVTAIGLLTGKWPHEHLWARLFVSRFLIPWLFVAAILMYYDLRTRKEGYNFRAFVEDLWMN